MSLTKPQVSRPSCGFGATLTGLAHEPWPPAPRASARRRWLRGSLAALPAALLCATLTSGVAAAQPATPAPDPGGAPPAPSSAPAATLPASPPPLAPSPPVPAVLIDPAVLEAAQQSIVGLVVIWEDPVDPFTGTTSPTPTPPPADDEPKRPVFGICSGWFDTPSTIVTAGHCVDPVEGRKALHADHGPRDDNGWPAALPPTALEPRRTVWAFQPRELPGAVLTEPVIVRVDELRSAEHGDIAKLAVAGLPPARPLPVAATNPRLGETVTSIGFPGQNMIETDGFDLAGFLAGGKSPVEVLQDSRLRPSNTSGTITAHQFRQGVPVYQVNADLGGGMSGGPTLNARGEVLGVNSQMTVPFFGQNFNVITDTGMLREFLRGPTAPPPPIPAAKALPAAAPAGEAAATGPTSPTPGQAPAPSAAGDTTPPATSQPLGWILAGGAIVGAVIGVPLGARFQRSRSNATTPTPEATAAATQKPDPPAPVPS